MFNALELTGRASTHVIEVPELGCTLHREVAEPVLRMVAAARADGVSIGVASAFRHFEKQVEIWNAKFQGKRPLYDRAGQLLDHSRLDAVALVDAILAWSALPGASRHHWGTDFDVVDADEVARGYQAQLLPQEFASGGVFARLNKWLARRAGQFGFFRPYRTDRGGVQPEPWHLSFAPLAVPALEALSLEMLIAAVSASTMHGREPVLARVAELYERYVRRIDAPEISSSSTPP
jgi:LAS superfamily LD-carboxypeptidase LdcB